MGDASLHQDNNRSIDIEGIADGDLLKYDTTPGEFVKLTPPVVVAAPSAVPAAISGGESPTEAEHNALRTALVDTRAQLVALQAALLAAGLMKAS